MFKSDARIYAVVSIGGDCQSKSIQSMLISAHHMFELFYSGNCLHQLASYDFVPSPDFDIQDEKDYDQLYGLRILISLYREERKYREKLASYDPTDNLHSGDSLLVQLRNQLSAVEQEIIRFNGCHPVTKLKEDLEQFYGNYFCQINKHNSIPWVIKGHILSELMAGKRKSCLGQCSFISRIEL